MFIGESWRSLTVDFRAVSQNPMSQPANEVRISEYAGRIVRNWYVVLVAVVAAVLLVVLHTVGTGKQFQGQATVFLGQPLSPLGGSPIPNTLVANPTTAQAYLRTSAVVDKAAAAANIKSGSVLKSHTSVTVLAGSSTAKTTGANPNIQITVLGPWDKRSVTTAAGSMANSLIAWASKYQTAKIDLLNAQIVTDHSSIATLQKVVDQAQKQVDALGHQTMTPAERASISSTLLSTIATAGSRIDEISFQLMSNQIFQASATDVESAGFVQEPSGQSVTATKRKSSLIVAVFTGLIVGVILALVWDAIRRRPRRTAEA
ncbi:MAG: hypothetical protein QOG33_1238 [Gaiellales bacterium]|nr:hypothetical protein [Gaiellales bacterium]